MVKMSKKARREASPVARAFSQNELRRICTMHEEEFGDAFGLKRYDCDAPAPDDFFFFKDNGAKILAVAHLDTVADHKARACHFLNTEAGQVVFSRSLDDRLGAYIILDLLPKLGVVTDVLLTTGEESGRSTADYFNVDKQYNWIIEFDRGGTDVVMYSYETAEMRDLLRESGMRAGHGSFSDIACLEHLKAKAFNWGTGYEDYHSNRSHAFLVDTFDMVDGFLGFYDAHKDTHFPHEERTYSTFGSGGWVRKSRYSWEQADPNDEPSGALSSGVYGFPSRSAGGWDWSEGAYADADYGLPAAALDDTDPAALDADTDEPSDEEVAAAMALFGYEPTTKPVKSIHSMTDEELFAAYNSEDGVDW